MGISQVKSPWDSSLNDPRRGISPGSRSSPSRAPDVVPAPPRVRPDHAPPEPVVGGEHRTPFDRLDRV